MGLGLMTGVTQVVLRLLMAHERLKLGSSAWPSTSLSVNCRPLMLLTIFAVTNIITIPTFIFGLLETGRYLYK